ncbi:hypothetical protein BpHYR1_021951 [Brachionus plicatilis]|uniref:Uncharacterized protein n=1 Tax=Brachionus plicatilis TaxID=10195 RepID=A0A3M7PZ74_BRAPC|nr:hypothetical protein BpHYR1_021951 [Brachionus plicatilis]
MNKKQILSSIIYPLMRNQKIISSINFGSFKLETKLIGRFLARIDDGVLIIKFLYPCIERLWL